MGRYHTERGWILDWIDRSWDHGYRLNYRKNYKFVDDTHTRWGYGKKLEGPGKVWGIKFDCKAKKWQFYSDGVLMFTEDTSKIPQNGKKIDSVN